MSEVFYRKYRAKNFSEIIGQDHVISVLRQAITNGKTAHAYLFSGPRGTGKTSTARLLAKALNCENFTQNQDVCGACTSCKNIESGTDLGTIEIDAASNRGINEIRQLRESISYSSGNGFKVYIIDEVHMLTTEAFNALLKTLEEPPTHVVFILATTELHKVPATILSRVQHFQFRLGSRDNVIKKLNHVLQNENYSAEPQVLELLFELADGGYRDAESLLGKLIGSFKKDTNSITEQEAYTILGLPTKNQVSSMMQHLLNANAMEALQQIDRLDQDGVNWQYFIRALLNETKQKIINNFAEAESTTNPTEVLKLLSVVYSQLKEFPSPKLALETEILLKFSESKPIGANLAKTKLNNNQEKIISNILAKNSNDLLPGNENQPPIQNIAENQELQVIKEDVKPVAVASDFDYVRFFKLVQPKLALAQILKVVKLEWHDPKLLIKPDTSVQVDAINKNIGLINQAIRTVTHDKAEAEIVFSDKLKSIKETQVKAKQSAREEQTNAKLVEELF